MYIDLVKAKAQLDILIQAALNGDEVFITKNKEPILKLVRVQASPEPGLLHRKESSAKPSRQSGTAKGLISVATDFDDPLDDFNEYL
jgi:antitoxin (DNA-binding transcriptional repressor) of toxin-antitoxin stability system